MNEHYEWVAWKGVFRAILYVDLQCNCILSRVTRKGANAFTVSLEEVIDDETIRFLLDVGDDQEAFERRFLDDETVTAVEPVGESNLLITKRSCGALPIIRKNHGMLHGVDRVNGNQRAFDILVFRRDDLRNIVADLREISQVRLGKLTPFTETGTTLSPRQAEVIEAALAGGYFEWPREMDAESLAAELDISHATFLEHLRKGEKKLLEEALNLPAPGTG